MIAQENYLLLIGDDGSPVKGEAEHIDYVEQILLLHWKWGMSGSHIGKKYHYKDKKNSSGERYEEKKFTINKDVDVASSLMLAYLDKGKTFEKAVITMSHSTHKKVLLRISMTDVRLMSCEVTVDDGMNSVLMKEEWELTYKNMEVIYSGEDMAGSMGNQYDSRVI